MLNARVFGLSSLILVLICGVGLLTSCSAEIVGSEPPTSPRAVFVLDHGRHSSLVLSREDGSLLRYSYGDWRYYAEGETDLIRMLHALFVPSQGAFGRRELPGPAVELALQQQLRVPVSGILSLFAEAEAVDRLQRELDALFWANQSSLVYRGDYDLEFVRHPQVYSARYHSNQAVADWLQALGFELKGYPFLSDWRLLDEKKEQ